MLLCDSDYMKQQLHFVFNMLLTCDLHCQHLLKGNLKTLRATFELFSLAVIVKPWWKTAYLIITRIFVNCLSILIINFLHWGARSQDWRGSWRYLLTEGTHKICVCKRCFGVLMSSLCIKFICYNFWNEFPSKLPAKKKCTSENII